MAPIRFFCQRCNLMMKIGAAMSGRTVVCPQCMERLTVPDRSDPQAEALYRFMKQKRSDEKASQIIRSLKGTGATTPSTKSEPASSGVPFPVPVQKTTESTPRSSPEPIHAPTTSKASETTIPAPEESLEQLEPEEVDRWIEEFWTSLPENEGVGGTPHPYKEESVTHPETSPAGTATTRLQQTRRLLRTLFVIVFLIGFVSGLFVYSRFVSFRSPPLASVTNTPGEGPAAGWIRGELFYPGFDGHRNPDTDAVVIFLPLNRVPTIPIISQGLKPNDELIDPNGDSAVQIREIGGYYRRAGADGSYSISFENEGKYLVLLISSHARREKPELDSTTLRLLRKYFLNPQELIGDYCFLQDEYELLEGQTYVLRHVFRDEK